MLRLVCPQTARDKSVIVSTWSIGQVRGVRMYLNGGLFHSGVHVGV